VESNLYPYRDPLLLTRYACSSSVEMTDEEGIGSSGDLVIHGKPGQVW